MSKKLIIRLSNNIGNQMFMYAAAYTFAKKLNRELLLDDQTAYRTARRIHEYKLNIFKFTSKIAPKNLKFLGLNGYLKSKTLKYFDRYKKAKNFYKEPKDQNKNTSFIENILNGDFANNLFVEGHFESEKYFKKYTSEIKREFTFKNVDSFTNNSFYKEIKNSNSVSICVRQHRFSEKLRAITKKDEEDSRIFTNDQINYIKKCISILKSKISNAKFFFWSNDFNNLSDYFPKNEFTAISTNKTDLDLFLMSQTKHFVVIPSSFNWWGCWLSQNKNKIVLRPSEKNFSSFKFSNTDLWPDIWLRV